jgi:hypothetical protein
MKAKAEARAQAMPESSSSAGELSFPYRDLDPAGSVSVPAGGTPVGTAVVKVKPIKLKLKIRVK